jgi:hypothetical protein
MEFAGELDLTGDAQIGFVVDRETAAGPDDTGILIEIGRVRKLEGAVGGMRDIDRRSRGEPEQQLPVQRSGLAAARAAKCGATFARIGVQDQQAHAMPQRGTSPASVTRNIRRSWP